MAGWDVLGGPYARVILINGLTQSPVYGPYIRGKLALAGVGLHTDLPAWLDAVYACWIDAPHEIMEKAFKVATMQAAKLRPDRETWGALPEHRALAGHLAGRPGAGGGYGGSQAPPTR